MIANSTCTHLASFWDYVLSIREHDGQPFFASFMFLLTASVGVRLANAP